MLILGYIVTAIAAYFLGSIPTGFLIARARGIDIRTVGSGNIGATNVSRAVGTVAGIFVLAVDVLKGFVACKLLGYAAEQIFAPSIDSFVAENFAIVSGLFAILGHNYTCWLHFKGGKGIATSLGVLIALFWKASLLVLAVFILVTLISRYVSLGSIMAAISLPILVWFLGYSERLVLVSFVIGALAVFKHKPNIQRLVQGAERRIGKKTSPPTESAP